MNTTPDEVRALLAMAGTEVKSFITKQTAAHEELNTKNMELQARLLELEQRAVHRPEGGGGDDDGGELAQIIAEHGATKSFADGNTPKIEIRVPSRLLQRKNLIVNETGAGQTLVAADRPRGIAFAPQRRLTIRGLFSQLPTLSNMIEAPRELLFTNAAGPQYDATSPPGPSTEGAIKPESGMTFEMVRFAVSTIAHWIRASRQVLSDAPLLQAHLQNRLLFGLALEEENEMLTGTGAGAELNGINNQAAAFTGGTGLTAMDTLATAANQLSVANYEPSGFILHPTDWLAIKLTKDSTGQYILGNPQQMASPMLWGFPVVPTPSQTLGQFTVLDAMRWGYIADREEAIIRISENVNDDFIRNIIRVLAENRVALIAEQPNAAIYGTLPS